MTESVINIFSNREIAVTLWVMIFLSWGVSNKDMRASFIDVIKSFFVKQIVVSILLMFIYVALITLLLKVVGLWDISQFKNTVLWCLTVATVMMFRAITISEHKYFFKNAILDNLKIIVIFEFIINLHTLNIWLELILVPFSIFLVLLIAVAEMDEKHKIVESILNKVLMLLGASLITYALYTISNDITAFTSYQNFQSFVIPPLLSALYLPFIYFFALFTTYQTLFVRYGLFIQDSEVTKVAKIITLKHLNVNLYNLKQWSHFVTPQQFKSKQSINEALQEFSATT